MPMCRETSCRASVPSKGHPLCPVHAPCVVGGLFNPADCITCSTWLRDILPPDRSPRLHGRHYGRFKDWWQTVSTHFTNEGSSLTWADPAMSARLGLSRPPTPGGDTAPPPPLPGNQSPPPLVMVVNASSIRETREESSSSPPPLLSSVPLTSSQPVPPSLPGARSRSPESLSLQRRLKKLEEALASLTPRGPSPPRRPRSPSPPYGSTTLDSGSNFYYDSSDDGASHSSGLPDCTARDWEPPFKRARTESVSTPANTSSPAMLYTWQPIPPDMAVRTMDGRYQVCSVTADGLCVPREDVELKESTDTSGDKKFLCRRIPRSRLQSRGKTPTVSRTAVLDAMDSISQSSLTDRPVMHDGPHSTWATITGQSFCPWQKTGTSPDQIWASTVAGAPFPPPAWNPLVFFPNEAFPEPLASFLNAPKLQHASFPYQTSPVPEDLLRKDFRARQQALTLTSCTSFLMAIGAWTRQLAASHTQMSTAHLTDILSATSTMAEGFGASLLPSLPPALKSAAGARLNARRSALRAHPKEVKDQLMRVAPFSPEIIPEAHIRDCLSSQPPRVTVVTQAPSSSRGRASHASRRPKENRSRDQPFRSSRSRGGPSFQRAPTQSQHSDSSKNSTPHSRQHQSRQYQSHPAQRGTTSSRGRGHRGQSRP